MSKFIKAAAFQITGKHIPQFGFRPLTVRFEASSIERPDISPVLKEYTFGVEWESRFYIKDDGEIGPQVERCIEELREAIYGDLLQKIRLLERAIYERSEIKSIEALKEILKEIYE